jgi:hypothetical protein
MLVVFLLCSQYSLCRDLIGWRTLRYVYSVWKRTSNSCAKALLVGWWGTLCDLLACVCMCRSEVGSDLFIPCYSSPTIAGSTGCDLCGLRFDANHSSASYVVFRHCWHCSLRSAAHSSQGKSDCRPSRHGLRRRAHSGAKLCMLAAWRAFEHQMTTRLERMCSAQQ